MPKRPRQHQLEDQSRLAFRAALPAEWVFRDSLPDYGIDGEVEIFDKNNVSTGLRFLVQLKATDEPDLNRALALSFRLDTCCYYHSLDLPVLIVRYHAPLHKLFTKWFDSFDPYYAKKGSRTITFRMTPQDEWNDGTPSRLSSDLKLRRQLRSSHLDLPLRFILTIPESEIHGVPAAQIASEIRRLAARLPGVIAISNDSSKPAHGSIVIENSKAVVELTTAGSFTLHTSKGILVEDTLSKFPSDVLIGVAVALDNMGHSNAAALLIREFATSSYIIGHPEIVIRLAMCMARAHRVAEALQLSEVLFEKREALPAAQLFMIAACIQSDTFSPGERQYLREVMRKRIQRAEEAGDWLDAAVAHYNLGRHLLRPGQERIALRHYRKAVEYDPAYLGRGYFCRELAGILFESGRYRLAAEWYARSISLSEGGGSGALHADALMFAGRYRDAQEAFDAYLASAQEPESEWRLKAWALRGIRRHVKCEEQERRTIAARELASRMSTDSPEESIHRLEEALRKDALCGLAWFNLGVLHSQARRRDDAFLAFLVASLSQRNDVEAWANAMALGIFSEEYRPLVPDIIKTAYSLNGERFSEQLVRFAKEQPDGFPATDFVNAIGGILTELTPKRRRFDLRLLGEGSSYNVTTIR